MPFYVKYIVDGNTVVEELTDCSSRKDAVNRLDLYRKKSDDGQVGLTSDSARIAQWQKLVQLESEITPKVNIER